MKNGKANTTPQTYSTTNGQNLSQAKSEALETVSALRSEIGEELKKTLLVAFNYVPPTSDDETVEATFSKAVLSNLAKLYTEAKPLIAAYEAKVKVWTAAGARLVSDHLTEFTTWAIGLAPVENEDKTPIMLTGINPEGIRVELPARLAISNSISFLLYALTDLSNTAIFGEAERIGRNGKKKPARPGIFENDKKSVESTRVIGGNENWGFRSTVNYLVKDGLAATKYCKVVELIALIAKLLNNDSLVEAEKNYKILTGQVKGDSRFNFDPSMIKDLVKARGYGLLVSGARNEIKTLKDKIRDGEQKVAWSNVESIELSRLASDLERHKNFSAAHPELTEKSEGLEVNAEKMTAVDESDVALRRAQGFFKRAIDAMVLDGTIQPDTITFKDDALKPSIQQFADGLISEDEIRIRCGSYYVEYMTAKQVTTV